MFILKKLWHDLKEHKDLIYYLTLSDLKTNTSRTYLGFLWWVLDPVLYMLVFYLLVQVILQRGGEGYAVFLFVALIPLKWTTSCLVDGTRAIVSHQKIIQQVYVPKIVFILSSLLVNTLKFVIGSVVLFLFIWIYGVNLSTHAVYYVAIAFVQFVLLLGGMIILAHLGVYVRDVRNAMQYVARMLFFLSPVLYTMKDVPQAVAPYLYLNPMTSLIVSYRNILLEQEVPLWDHLLVILFAAVVLLYVSLKLLFKYEKEYAKVI
ncbi:transport permease protein [Caldalkalibacillus thermarum]|uniref:ABC transporter permease n=1 Tax=Caldalkalibacillus thermarum TaxID=296745 RepID=UPI00166E6C06|nr:ABC transporter permease [Caldalkalibacillus thermarum]GGK29003.1 transport permease protein [Caldalkalibacillus thermarum]